MRRSEINRVIRDADSFIRSFGFMLPPFAHMPPEDLLSRRDSLRAVFDARLGWDVTDYGKGAFPDLGLVLFTLRNGNAADLQAGRGMLYAEKIMISRAGQLAPMHRHNVKAEDIINRGGAALGLTLFASKPDGAIDPKAPVDVMCDGRRRRLHAGETLRLSPGESVTLMPGIWHDFRAEGGDVLIGEVSTVNDVVTDNVFAEPVSRFSAVEEDEPPCRLLVSDYEARLG